MSRYYSDKIYEYINDEYFYDKLYMKKYGLINPNVYDIESEFLNSLLKESLTLDWLSEEKRQQRPTTHVRNETQERERQVRERLTERLTERVRQESEVSASGGYEEKLFTQPIDTSFLCPICTDICRDAVSIIPDDDTKDECGQVFCRGCLTKSLSRKESCPKCRNEATVRNIKSNKFVEQRIQALQVKCVEKDCEWTGCLSDLQKHKCKPKQAE